jgi:TetR/AcrR family transcriptional regulator, copper-responsive repressor
MSEADPKPARGRPKTMNAEQVLDVAMTAYWQSDPADVSVNAICQMAGMKKKWSGQRESNPHHQLGKLRFYH